MVRSLFGLHSFVVYLDYAMEYLLGYLFSEVVGYRTNKCSLGQCGDFTCWYHRIVLLANARRHSIFLIAYAFPFLFVSSETGFEILGRISCHLS